MRMWNFRPWQKTLKMIPRLIIFIIIKRHFQSHLLFGVFSQVLPFSSLFLLLQFPDFSHELKAESEVQPSTDEWEWVGWGEGGTEQDSMKPCPCPRHKDVNFATLSKRECCINYSIFTLLKTGPSTTIFKTVKTVFVSWNYCGNWVPLW